MESGIEIPLKPTAGLNGPPSSEERECEVVARLKPCPFKLVAGEDNGHGWRGCAAFIFDCHAEDFRGYTDRERRKNYAC